MKRNTNLLSIITALIMNNGMVWSQDTPSFFYQGRLSDTNGPLTGNYDLVFHLHAAPTGNTILASATNANVAVSNGLFTTALNLGEDYWGDSGRVLEIGLRPAGSNVVFTMLSPKQPVLYTPQAIRSKTAAFSQVAGFATNFNGSITGDIFFERPGAAPFSVMNNTNQVAALNASYLGTMSKADFIWLGGNDMMGTVAFGGKNNYPVNLLANNYTALRLEAPIGIVSSIGGTDITYSDLTGAVCGGGRQHQLTTVDYGFIGGGFSNRIDNCSAATVTGGNKNHIGAGGDYSVIGGGALNAVTNGSVGNSVIGGGTLNSITGTSSYGAIGGGYSNSISGLAFAGCIPGGYNNMVAGFCSLAAGREARALHPGAFVWADNTGGVFDSATNNSFNIRANGGMFITSTPGIVLNALDAPLITRTWDVFNQTAGAKAGVGRWGMFMEPSRMVLGMPAIANKTINLVKYNEDGTYVSLTHVDQSGNLYTAGTVNPPSDRNVKQDFKPIDSLAILDQVTQLPIKSWAYTNSPDARHIGPVAQDFKSMFGFGTSDKSIATVDADGVALAAIQGLYQKVTEQSAALQAKEARLQQQQQQISELIQRLSVLEKRLNSPQ